MTVLERFREGVARAALGNRLDELESEVTAWRESYSARPWRFTSDMLDPLMELDSRYVDLLARLRGYDLVHSGGNVAEPTEQDRLMAVDEARQLYRYDVLSAHSIRLWTNFGFGQRIDVTPRDDAAAEIWQEFFTARRNRSQLGERNIHKLSDTVLTDGEIFLTFFTSIEGETTVRRVPTEQIREIIAHPDDADTPLWYHRMWTDETGKSDEVWYPDWAADLEDLEKVKSEKLPKDAKIATELGEKKLTRVVMLHAAHNTLKRRGWPISVAAGSWSREHKIFRQNRAAVSRARAALVDELKIKGGSRGLEAMRQRWQSSLNSGGGVETNPAPVAASTLFTNDQVEHTQKNLTTGASDAKTDGEALAWLTLIGYGVFPHYGGMGDTYRLATATSMETPIQRQWMRYQLWWADVWSDMVELVTRAYEEAKGTVTDDYTADVATDALVETDLTQLSALLKSFEDALAAGLIEAPAAAASVRKLLQSALQTMGVNDVDEIIPNEPEMEPQAVQTANAQLAAQDANADPNNPNPAAGVPPESLPPDTVLTPELAEIWTKLAEASISNYGESIRAAVRGLWKGVLSEGQFVETMFVAIRRNITAAWYAGAKSVGIAPDELTDTELLALNEMIQSELGFVLRFAFDIQKGSADNGGKVTPLLERAALWQNRFTDAENQARLLASNDPKLEWVYGDTEHCPTCARLHGKVKRASQWRAKNIYPQKPPNPNLKCGGWKCKCRTVPTSKPLSKGPLPSVP
jgi:hypothetical protein